MSAQVRSPTFADLVSAQELLRGHAVVTPLLESPELSALAGGRLLFKAESLQRTGSYKFRGAYNRLSRLSDEERQRGIVAFSTGNFGQAVAGVGIEPGHTSICDAIQTPIPAELPFRTLRERITKGLVVEDEHTLHAMAMAFTHLKLVLEPAGAIALAAALSGKFDCRGKTVAILCSGASVDVSIFRRALDLVK